MTSFTPKSITTVSSLSGKTVLLRSSINVPIQRGVVVNDFRLERALPTILFLQEQGARVIIIGHRSGDSARSVRPVFDYLREHIDVIFVKNLFDGNGSAALSEMKNGDVILAENIRQYEGERNNDPEFVKKLASLADIFVNDDFTVAHRKHAAVVGIPKLLPSYVGVRFLEEFIELSKAFNPPSPSTIIIGGAKPETKIPLAEKFLDIADNVFLGGISANTLFHAQGISIGHSQFSGMTLGLSSLLDHPNLVVPEDMTVLHDGLLTPREIGDIGEEDLIIDTGPKTVGKLEKLIEESAFILWNGPLGDTDKGFKQQTERIAEKIACCGRHSIVGGGDTVAAIEDLGLLDKFSFVSTAGGSMVDFLAYGTLPGLEALKN